MSAQPKALAYAHRLRSPLKRAYAIAYYRYRAGKAAQSPPSNGLSFMAAQAVRMNINELLA